MFLHLIVTVVSMAAMAFANRSRGTGKMLVALAILCPVAAYFGGLLFMAAVLASYFLWDLAGGWGRWYTLNNLPRDIAGPPDWYEKLVEKVAGDNDYVALTIRMTIGCLPIMATGLYFFGVPGLLPALLLPLAMVVAYSAAWKIFPLSGRHTNQIETAEFFTGALWALTLSLMRLPVA